MSSPISQALWETEFGDRPMPEGTTMVEFHAACDYIDRHKDRLWAIEQLKRVDGIIKWGQPGAKAWAETEQERVLGMLDE